MEVNTRVNYPLKAALVEMTNAGEISMDDSTTQFCTSWFTIKVADVRVCICVCVCVVVVCVYMCVCVFIFF